MGSVPLVRAQEKPILLGDIRSYSVVPQWAEPYRMGWQPALDEINASGGVLGRPVEVISRDDAGKPDVAARAIQELVASEGVTMLFGTILSHVGLAVADVAHHNEVAFFASGTLTDALSGNPAIATPSISGRPPIRSR